MLRICVLMGEFFIEYAQIQAKAEEKGEAVCALTQGVQNYCKTEKQSKNVNLFYYW